MLPNKNAIGRREMMKTRSMIVILFLAVVVCLALAGKKRKEPMNRETTPFWLRDSEDGMSTTVHS